MKTIIVIVEGQTEEAFINRVVAPQLWQLNLSLEPRLVPTSKATKGGALSYARFIRFLQNTLKERSDTAITSLIDLYALDTDFPKYAESRKISDLYQSVACLEEGLHEAIVSELNFDPARFIPFIQPHEYEGLLFSEVSKFGDVEPKWQGAISALKSVYCEFDNPEHINNSFDTKPSRRLEQILQPKYRKTRHGPLLAKKISLAKIEAECPHFHAWLNKLRALSD